MKPKPGQRGPVRGVLAAPALTRQAINYRRSLAGKGGRR